MASTAKKTVYYHVGDENHSVTVNQGEEDIYHYWYIQMPEHTADSTTITGNLLWYGIPTGDQYTGSVTLDVDSYRVILGQSSNDWSVNYTAAFPISLTTNARSVMHSNSIPLNRCTFNEGDVLELTIKRNNDDTGSCGFTYYGVQVTFDSYILAVPQIGGD